MEGRLAHYRKVSMTEAVQMLCCGDTNDVYASHFRTYPQSCKEDEIPSEVEEGNGYYSCGEDILLYPIPSGLDKVYEE